MSASRCSAASVDREGLEKEVAVCGECCDPWLGSDGDPCLVMASLWDSVVGFGARSEQGAFWFPLLEGRVPLWFFGVVFSVLLRKISWPNSQDRRR